MLEAIQGIILLVIGLIFSYFLWKVFAVINRVQELQYKKATFELYMYDAFMASKGIDLNSYIKDEKKELNNFFTTREDREFEEFKEKQFREE